MSDVPKSRAILASAGGESCVPLYWIGKDLEDYCDGVGSVREELSTWEMPAGVWVIEVEVTHERYDTVYGMEHDVYLSHVSDRPATDEEIKAVASEEFPWDTKLWGCEGWGIVY